MITIQPVSLNLTPDSRLEIGWSDGTRRSYGFGELRNACPCATCREKRDAKSDAATSFFTILKPEEARPLKVEGMKPVGNYAYAVAFSDGHDTGIYTFEYLLEIGREVPAG